MRFAFIVHPLDKRDITRRYKFLRQAPLWLIECLLPFIRPSVVGQTEGIYSDQTGQGVEGLFVGVPLTARLLKKLPLWFVNWRILQAVRLGHSLGARVAGLGAHTACVGDAGITINSRSPIPVTTGNSQTIAMACQAAQDVSDQLFPHLPKEQRVLAIVGVSGSIGQACTEILKDHFGQLVLVGRSWARVWNAVDRMHLGGKRFIVTEDFNELLRAHVVVSVTSSDSAVIRPRHLSPGTVVVDVARPRDVSVRVQKERPDVLVIEGGVVAVPGLPDMGLDFGFGKGHAYACMSETMTLALEGMGNGGIYRALTVGKNVSVDHVLEASRLAFIHGFKLAGYRSFEKEVSPEDIARVMAYSLKREPGVVIPGLYAE